MKLIGQTKAKKFKIYPIDERRSLIEHWIHSFDHYRYSYLRPYCLALGCVEFCCGNHIVTLCTQTQMFRTVCRGTKHVRFLLFYCYERLEYEAWNKILTLQPKTSTHQAKITRKNKTTTRSISIHENKNNQS